MLFSGRPKFWLFRFNMKPSILSEMKFNFFCKVRIPKLQSFFGKFFLAYFGRPLPYAENGTLIFFFLKH